MAKPSFFSSDLVQVLLCPRLHELQFAVKALLAGGLALYLAFSLELEQPQWALMTVFVVSQPYSGMVLAKGMFRLIGTCAGALVSIGMVALYGQASLPFLLLMALWLAFCTAGASLLHNHASYGFVLAGLNFLRGILLSIPLAGFVALFYLPGVDGFPLLCLGLGVPLFFAALCVNRASLAGIASPFCIFFVKNVAPSNSMSYDLAHFLNNALSTVLGVAFAVLVFNLVSLRPGERHYRRMLQATLGDLARLTLRSPAQAEAWFGGRTADRLIRLAQRYDRLPEGRRQPWSDGLMGLDFGDELLYLRQCLEEVPASLAQARDRYLRRLRLALLGDGPRAEREHALDPPTARLLKALAASPLAGSERGELAGAALVQLQATWRQWCRSHAPAGTALRADPLPGAGR
nr:FUSC family protein [Pseudomonas aeruginosa]